jgi:hypothetical protein
LNELRQENLKLPNELRVDVAEGNVTEEGYKETPYQSELDETGRGRALALDLEFKAMLLFHREVP